MNYSNFITGPIKKEYRKGGGSLFKIIKPFEIILFIISFSLSSYFLFRNGTGNIKSSDWIIWVDLSIGIIAAILLSRRWKWSWLVLAFDAILYGVAMYLTGNYAIGFVNMILSPMILFFALITWKNHKNQFEQTIETRKVNLSQGFIVTFVIFLLTATIGFITVQITNSETQIEKSQDWLNAFAASITLFAMIASIFRFRETWYLYFLNNIVKIILFSLLVWKSYDENIISLILASTYFINSIYGMFIWKDGEFESIFNKIRSPFKDPSDGLFSVYNKYSGSGKSSIKDPSDGLFSVYNKGIGKGKKSSFKDPSDALFSSYNKKLKTKKYSDPSDSLLSLYKNNSFVGKKTRKRKSKFIGINTSNDNYYVPIKKRKRGKKNKKK